MTTTFMWEVLIRRSDGSKIAIHVTGVGIRSALERAEEAIELFHTVSFANYPIVGIRRLDIEPFYVKES